MWSERQRERSRRLAGGNHFPVESGHGFRHRGGGQPLNRPRGQHRDVEFHGAALNPGVRKSVFSDGEGEWQEVKSRRRYGSSRLHSNSDLRRRRRGQSVLRPQVQVRKREYQAAVRNPSRLLDRIRMDSSLRRGFTNPLRPAIREFSERKIYFEDFPNGMSNHAMKRIFCRFGVDGWVYVARKRNLRNLNFGFLTIDGNRSIEDAIARLNDIKIGPAFLKASRARYSAPRTLATPKPRITTSKPIREYRESKRDYRSFSDVVASKMHKDGSHEVSISKRAAPTVVPASSGDSYESSMVVQPAIWKSRACRVRLSNIAMIRNIYDYLTEHGFQVDFAAPCGDDNVIVAFESPEFLHTFMNNDWTTLNHVIAAVEPIDSDYVPNECLVYVDFMGIPPVFICEEVVRDLAARYGKVVAIDSELARPDRLDVVSCLVSVPMGTEVKEITVTLRNKEYIVFSAIRQGVGCDRCNNQFEDYSSEDETDSSNDVESESDIREDASIVREEPVVMGSGGLEAEDNPRAKNSAKSASLNSESRNNLITREEPVVMGSGGLEAEDNSRAENSAKSASLNFGSRNNLIIREESVEQAESEDMLTFKVGKALGLFNDQNSSEVVGLLGGKR